MGKEEMPEESMNNEGFLPSCFYTGFNGPIDPGFAHIAHACEVHCNITCILMMCSLDRPKLP